ncbi:hypothetical protein EJD97_012038 [Solanum chilense]|uniref:Uncharacterized protein n=1 Tax=Solanum chilense TaxID=4083 RepID=A0A6N2CH19_SOLCI|nr:hypothetical protein EJD97_012038 [Solanum chilense]
MDLVTGRRGHDGPSWPPSSYTLQILLLLSSLPLTNRYDGPFQARWFVEGLHSITLELFGIRVLGLLYDHHDEPAGRTVVAMTVLHEHCNPTLRSDFPIFLQQLHYNATYGPSQARRTVTGPVGGNFFAFLAQKLPHSYLDRFLANKEKFT